MYTIKTTTAVAMSTLMSLFGCSDPKYVTLTNESVEIKGVAAKEKINNGIDLFLKIKLSDRNDSIFTVIATDATKKGINLIGKLDKGKTYSIDGSLQTFEHGKSKEGNLVTHHYLEIVSFKELTSEQRVMQLQNKIEQTEDIIKSCKANNKREL